MLQQAKDTTLDSISEEDEFSDLGVLDDSNSMYMVRLLGGSTPVSEVE